MVKTSGNGRERIGDKTRGKRKKWKMEEGKLWKKKSGSEWNGGKREREIERKL